MKEQEIIHTLNNKKYLLISFQRTYDSTENYITKLGGIYRGIENKQPTGFFNNGHEIIQYLIPEDKVQEATKVITTSQQE